MISRIGLGIDPATGAEKFEVLEDGVVIGYDFVFPSEE